jgi:cobalt transporter subunit CbtB
MTEIVERTGQAAPAERVRTAVAAAAALLLGVFIVFGVGFAAPSLLHNATHDTRHSLGLPCH